MINVNEDGGSGGVDGGFEDLQCLKELYLQFCCWSIYTPCEGCEMLEMSLMFQVSSLLLNTELDCAVTWYLHVFWSSSHTVISWPAIAVGRPHSFRLNLEHSNFDLLFLCLDSGIFWVNSNRWWRSPAPLFPVDFYSNKLACDELLLVQRRIMINGIWNFAIMMICSKLNCYESFKLY